MIKLGQKVEDPITGFEGTVTIRSEYLYGCIRIGVSPKVDRDGKLQDTIFFDEPQLEGLPFNEPKVKSGKDRPGGPRPDPTPK